MWSLEAVILPNQSRRDAFSRRSTSLFSQRGFSREPSQPNIYAPPTLGLQNGDSSRSGDKDKNKVKKTTPGRRGEKRKKSVIDESMQADARSKKMGRVLMPSLSLPEMVPPRTSQHIPGSDLPRIIDDVFRADSRSASVSSFGGEAGVEVLQNPVEQKNKSVSEDYEDVPRLLLLMVEMILFNVFRPSRSVYARFWMLEGFRDQMRGSTTSLAWQIRVRHLLW